MPTKKQLKRKENETYDQWLKRLKSFYPDDQETINLILESDQVKKNNTENKKLDKLKKNTRINLWVTESFYSDINVLHGLFHNKSTSEMIVSIVEAYIEQIKNGDPHVWTLLEKFNELDKIKEKHLKQFLEEISIENIIKEIK